METFLFTLWALWPNGTDSVILSWSVATVADCYRFGTWFSTTLRADGVQSIAWSCISQWPV